jgi:hypothetical protein
LKRIVTASLSLIHIESFQFVVDGLGNKKFIGFDPEKIQKKVMGGKCLKMSGFCTINPAGRTSNLTADTPNSAARTGNSEDDTRNSKARRYNFARRTFNPAVHTDILVADISNSFVGILN